MHVPSRTLYAGLFRFVLVSLTALVLLAGTTLFIATLLAFFRDGSWDQPAYLSTGLCCGLIAWLFIACFHLRHETQALPVEHGELFLSEAVELLQEMGYTLTARQAGQLTFHPSFHAFLFGGRLRIVMAGQTALLTGPKMSLEIFRRRFRLKHHVQRVQKVLHEQRKFTDNLIKRVELRLRLQPHQWEAVGKNVLGVLQQEARVVCDLSLLVQSERGIRENTIEFQIREWLDQQGIACDVHKDRVQFTEVVPTEHDLAITSVAAF